MIVDSKFSTIIIKILFLIVLFLFGYYFDAIFLKRKDLACITWFWGLAVLTVWIIFPPTTIRICVGAIVFIVGMIFLVRYYKKSRNKKDV